LYFCPIGRNSTETKPQREKETESIVFSTRSSASHLVAAHLCLVPTCRDVDRPSKSGTRPLSQDMSVVSGRAPVSYRTYIEKARPYLTSAHQTGDGDPPRGKEMKPDVVQNSENCRPWRLDGLTRLAGRRMRLFFNKSENCITKIALMGPSWPLVILDSLAAHFLTAPRRSAFWK
jgi:hypothetical protein